MDLNSEAVSDLDDVSAIDQDIISESTVEPDTSERISSTEPEVKSMNEEVNVISDAVLAQEVITEVEETVDMLREIEGDTLEQDSISKHDAATIDGALEGELTSRVGLEEFTTHRSKTNFQFATKLLRSKIVALEEQYNESVTAFISKNLSSCGRTLEMLKESSIEDTICDVIGTKNRFETFTGKLSENSNMNMPYDGGFVNVTKIDILDFDPRKLNLGDSKVETVTQDIATLDNAISNMKTVLSSTSIRTAIHSHLNDTEAANLCAMTPNVGKYAVEPVTIQTLADLFNSHVTVEFLESLNDLIDSKLKLIDKLSQEPLEGKSYDEVVTFNKSYSQDITRLLTIELPFIRQWLQTIRQLSFYAREVFSVLEKY
jgi:hypothetical protein